MTERHLTSAKTKHVLSYRSVIVTDRSIKQSNTGTLMYTNRVEQTTSLWSLGYSAINLPSEVELFTITAKAKHFSQYQGTIYEQKHVPAGCVPVGYTSVCSWFYHPVVVILGDKKKIIYFLLFLPSHGVFFGYWVNNVFAVRDDTSEIIFNKKDLLKRTMKSVLWNYVISTLAVVKERQRKRLLALAFLQFSHLLLGNLWEPNYFSSLLDEVIRTAETGLKLNCLLHSSNLYLWKILLVHLHDQS